MRKLAAVLARVCLEVARTAEALAALGTFVRPFTRMDELVLFEMGQLREGLSALLADERSLSSVNSDVHFEVGQLREDLLAVAAVVDGLPVLLVQLVGKRAMSTQFFQSVWCDGRNILMFVFVVFHLESSISLLFGFRAGHHLR